jgi:DNA-binding transcriptional regulator YbjK
MDTRRPRRHDPTRRDRLIDATLTLIADQGVAGVSHRAVARAADVPLGSTTYHFTSLEDLLAEAFTRHADSIATVFEERMRSAPTPRAAVDSIAEHLATDLLGSTPALVLSVELYVAAARSPSLRTVTQAWMRRSRAALEHHFDPTTARELDALIEGLALHSALSTDPMTPEQIHSALHRFIR